MLDVEGLAREAYEAYAAFTGGKTWDGRPMPSWEGLTDKIRGAWGAAVGAALKSAANTWLAGFQRRGVLLAEALQMLRHEPPEAMLRALVTLVRAELGMEPEKD